MLEALCEVRPLQLTGDAGVSQSSVSSAISLPFSAHSSWSPLVWGALLCTSCGNPPPPPTTHTHVSPCNPGSSHLPVLTRERAARQRQVTREAHLVWSSFPKGQSRAAGRPVPKSSCSVYSVQFCSWLGQEGQFVFITPLW